MSKGEPFAWVAGEPSAFLYDDLAAHLGVDVAEVVNDSTVRLVGHCLSDREISSISRSHPHFARIEECRLIAVEARVASVRANRRYKREEYRRIVGRCRRAGPVKGKMEL